MDRRTLILTGLAAALPLAASAADLTIEDAIARHVAARGGAAALDRIKACRIRLDITEGGQTLQGVYAAELSGLVRIDIFVGGQRVYREGVDSQGVWLWPGGEAEPRDSVAAGSRNALLHGLESNLVGMHRFVERGHKLRLMPPEIFDGVRHPVIEVVFVTGHTSYFYLDPTTWLITRRRDRRAYHPDADLTQKRVETRYADFRTVDGVVSADRNEDFDLADNSLLSVNQVTERVWNPSLPAGLFDRGHTPV